MRYLIQDEFMKFHMTDYLDDDLKYAERAGVLIIIDMEEKKELIEGEWLPVRVWGEQL